MHRQRRAIPKQLIMAGLTFLTTANFALLPAEASAGGTDKQLPLESLIQRSTGSSLSF